MSRETEILQLLRSVNPARPEDDEIDRVAPRPLPPRIGLAEPSGHVSSAQPRWAPLAAAVMVLVVITGLTNLWGQDDKVSTSGLAAGYTGSLIRDGGPGEADVRYPVSLDISDAGDDLTGVLTHGAPGAPSLDESRSVVMPVTVTIIGPSVEVRWAPSVGSYEDTTLEQCRWQEWALTFDAPDAIGRLHLRHGIVTGLPPVGPDVGEFLSGCPAGEREVLSLVLAPR